MIQVGILVSLALCASSFDYSPPKYTIDLDLPPYQRFQQVFIDFKEAIEFYTQEMMGEVESLGLISDFLPYAIDSAYLEPEMKEELQGAADASGLNYDDLMIFNFVNELHSHCTSTLAKASDGSIIVARNMDQARPDTCWGLVVDYTYVKNGQILYKATGLAGILGVITGMREGAFSIAMNQRFKGSVQENIARALESTKGSLQVVRYALENFDNYYDARDYLISSEACSGSFYTIGGLGGNEGAVITNNGYRTLDVWQLNDERWYLFVNNDDHWEPPYGGGDTRRHKARAMYEQIGIEGMNESEMYRVLSRPPVLSSISVASIVTNPSTGYYRSAVREREIDVSTTTERREE